MTEASKPWTRWLLVLQALLLLLAALGPLSHNLDLLPFRPAFLAMLLGIGLASAQLLVDWRQRTGWEQAPAGEPPRTTHFQEVNDQATHSFQSYVIKGQLVYTPEDNSTSYLFSMVSLGLGSAWAT